MRAIGIGTGMALTDVYGGHWRDSGLEEPQGDAGDHQTWEVERGGLVGCQPRMDGHSPSRSIGRTVRTAHTPQPIVAHPNHILGEQNLARRAAGIAKVTCASMSV